MSEEEFANRFTVGGVENPERIISDFWNTINSEKVNVNLLVDDDVYQVEYDGKIIIVINVPQASYKSKPVYINGNLLKGSYKRKVIITVPRKKLKQCCAIVMILGTMVALSMDIRWKT